MSTNTAELSVPSAVNTSTKATTPFKHVPPLVELISAARDLSFAASSMITLSSPVVAPVIVMVMLELCLGLWTAESREEVEVDAARFGLGRCSCSGTAVVRLRL
jgi:hypothetical protein